MRVLMLAAGLAAGAASQYHNHHVEVDCTAEVSARQIARKCQVADGELECRGSIDVNVVCYGEVN